VQTTNFAISSESYNFNKEATTASASVTKDRNLPEGNSESLRRTCGVDARTDARHPTDGQFPFFTALSLKRILRRSLVSLAITAMYKGEMGETGER